MFKLQNLSVVLLFLLTGAVGACGGVPKTRDITGPHVIKTSPANGEKNVPVNVVLDVWFSEAIVPNSLLPTTVVITPRKGFTLAFPAPNQMRVIFLGKMPYGRQVTIVINPTVSDVDDNPMEGAYIWSYFTEPNTTPSPPVATGGDGTILTNQTPFSLAGSKQFETILLVNGVLRPEAGNLIPFQVKIPLEEGPNQVRLQARLPMPDIGKFLDSTATLVQIVLDTIAPAAPTPVPALPAATSLDSIPLSGVRNGNEEIQGTLNGLSLVIENATGTWSTLLALVEGSNTLALWATDAAGNRSSTNTFTILRDATPPLLTLTPLPQFTSAGQITITGSASEAVQFYVNGVAAGNSSNLSYLCTLQPGANHIIVAALDAMGNRIEKVLYTQRDTTAPRLLAILPTQGAQVTGSVQTIRYLYDSELNAPPAPSTITSKAGGLPQNASATSLEGHGHVLSASVSLTAPDTYNIYSQFQPADLAGNTGIMPTDRSVQLLSGLAPAAVTPGTLTVSSPTAGSLDMAWSPTTAGSWYLSTIDQPLAGGLSESSIHLTNTTSAVQADLIPFLASNLIVTSLQPNGMTALSTRSVTADVWQMAELSQVVTLVGSDDIRLAAGDLNGDLIADLVVAYPSISRVEIITPTSHDLAGWKNATTKVVTGSGRLGETVYIASGKLWLGAPEMNARAGCVFRLDGSSLPGTVGSTDALVCGSPGDRLGNNLIPRSDGTFWASAPGISGGAVYKYSSGGVLSLHQTGYENLLSLGNWQEGKDRILLSHVVGKQTDFLLIDGATGVIQNSFQIQYTLFEPVAGIADLNGDGHEDLLILKPGSNPSVDIYAGGWYPDLTASDRTLSLPAAFANHSLRAAGTVRAAGSAQQWIIGYGTGSSARYGTLAGASQFFGGMGGLAETLITPGDNLQDHVLGSIDFNGDGKKDLLYRPSFSGTLRILY